MNHQALLRRLRSLRNWEFLNIFLLPFVLWRVLVGAGLLWLFAILEQINYYHLQLMHDNPHDIRYLIQHQRLRQSPLRSDLAYARNLKRNL